MIIQNLDLERFARDRDWQVSPMWTIARRVDRKGYPEAELLSVYRDYGVIRKSDRDDNHNVESEDLSSYKYVRVGDLVLNKMKTWQGSLGVSPYEGIVSPAYFTFELSPSVFGPFIHHLLRSEPYIAMYGALSKGIRVGQWDLPYEEFRDIPVLLPPIEEQRRIAEYLDGFNKPLALMEAEEELLKEELKALLDDGFQNFVKTNPIVPLRKLVSQRDDYRLVRGDERYDLLGVRWYGGGPFIRESVLGSESSATKLQEVRAGTVIYNRLFAWKESFGVVPTDLEGTFASSEFPMFECKDNLSAEFLNAFLLSPRVTSLITLQSQGASSISRSRWKELELLKLEIPLPDIRTQRNFVALVNRRRDLLSKIERRRETYIQLRDSMIENFLFGTHTLDNVEEKVNG